MTREGNQHTRVRQALEREQAAHQATLSEAVRLLTQAAMHRGSTDPASAHARLATTPGQVSAEVLRALHQTVDFSRTPAPGCPWCSPYLPEPGRSRRSPRAAAPSTTAPISASASLVAGEVTASG